MDVVNPPDGFSGLGIDFILDAVESTGYVATGRVQQLNSMENRVYAVEIDAPDTPRGIDHLIVKFYRPERWSAGSIVSEHALMRMLGEENISTPPLLDVLKPEFVKPGTPLVRDKIISDSPYGEKNTLGFIGGYHFAVWRKVMGRIPLDLTTDDLLSIGRMVARMHNLFESHVHVEAFDRPALTVKYAFETPLENLRKWNGVPRHFQGPLFGIIEELAHGLRWVEDACDYLPVHGDLHRLNLMQTSYGGEFWLVDFDDCLRAPEVQDLWLLASTCNVEVEEGQDPTKVAFEILREGYEEFRLLPQDSELLIEPLRTFRMVYYLGWISGRWYDPFFRQTFSFFTESDYWERTYCDLCDQKQKLLEEGLLDPV